MVRVWNRHRDKKGIPLRNGAQKLARFLGPANEGFLCASFWGINAKVAIVTHMCFVLCWRGVQRGETGLPPIEHVWSHKTCLV